MRRRARQGPGARTSVTTSHSIFQQRDHSRVELCFKICISTITSERLIGGVESRSQFQGSPLVLFSFNWFDTTVELTLCNLIAFVVPTSLFYGVFPYWWAVSLCSSRWCSFFVVWTSLLDCSFGVGPWDFAYPRKDCTPSSLRSSFSCFHPFSPTLS